MSNNRNKKVEGGRTVAVEDFAAMFKALSNPHRLKIYIRLASCCTPGTVFKADAAARSCVGDLGQNSGLSPSTVSHHIKALHHAGLIRMERRGQNMDCWIDPEALNALSGFFSAVPAA